jgi:hypothetical protein
MSDLKTADEIMYTSWSNYRFFLIENFMPATARLSNIVYRAKIHHESTKTILALLRWRFEKDQYPVALGELVAAGFLNELPMDPFGDKPLGYKRTDDNFILYSVGPDFKDDGGVSGKDRKGRDKQWLDNGDTVFWPLPKSDI